MVVGRPGGVRMGGYIDIKKFKSSRNYPEVNVTIDNVLFFYLNVSVLYRHSYITTKKPIVISFIIYIIGSIIYLNLHIESKITNPKNIFLY